MGGNLATSDERRRRRRSMNTAVGGAAPTIPAMIAAAADRFGERLAIEDGDDPADLRRALRGGPIVRRRPGRLGHRAG